MKIKNHRKKKDLYKLIVALLVTLITIVLLDARIRPLVNDLAQNQARAEAISLIQTAVSEVLSEQGAVYDNLVSISKDNEGRVTAVSSDSLRINQLKTHINLKISEKMAEVDVNSFTVPLGSAIGGNLFSGRGPKINVKFKLAGHAQTEITNVFNSAGINQTQHQIMLAVNTGVYVIIPGRQGLIEVSTDLIIAETIIVGLVPDNYTGIEIGKDGGAADELRNQGRISQK